MQGHEAQFIYPSSRRMEIIRGINGNDLARVAVLVILSSALA
jgi:hypothetical protein